MIDDEAERIVTTAEALFAKYERHDDAPEAADAIIAATAIESGLVLITENWRDFHFIEEMAFVDIRNVAKADLPVMHVRAPAQGQLVWSNGCCRKLLRDRGLAPKASR